MQTPPPLGHFNLNPWQAETFIWWFPFFVIQPRFGPSTTSVSSAERKQRVFSCVKLFSTTVKWRSLWEAQVSKSYTMYSVYLVFVFFCFVFLKALGLGLICPWHKLCVPQRYALKSDWFENKCLIRAGMMEERWVSGRMVQVFSECICALVCVCVGVRACVCVGVWPGYDQKRGGGRKWCKAVKRQTAGDAYFHCPHH